MRSPAERRDISDARHEAMRALFGMAAKHRLSTLPPATPHSPVQILIATVSPGVAPSVTPLRVLCAALQK